METIDVKPVARRVVAGVAAAALLLTLIGPAAGAVLQPPQGQPPQGQDEFVPARNLPAQEQLPATPLVIGAYAFVWVVLLAFVWSVWRRQQHIQKELVALERRVGRAG